MDNTTPPARDASSNSPDTAAHSPVDNTRREFLLRAGAVASGLAVGLASSGCAGAQDAQAQEKPQEKPPEGDEVVLKLDAASPLLAVGGWQTIDTAEGKVIVAHTAENKFAACSAICTHKGGPIKYDAASGEFFCPLHGSRFDTSGKVLRPPAREPLQSFASGSGVVVSLKK